jgi:serine/threonine-protein kinase
MPQESASKGGKRPVRIGKYEVIAHIATGGMGAVYKAVDTELGRFVALKVLSPEMAAKPNMVERFKREARSAARLRHENIVAIYECGKWGDTNYLALEFVDGCDLHDYITRRGRLDSDEARHILMQAARALDHAFRNKIVHRDIKPSNFLLTADEEGRLLVKLTDLGLARQVHDEEFRVTRADSTIGTVDYMSPEQAQNSGAADVRSDIYSLGCTYYHMLSGKCPFPTGSLVERILKHREAEPLDIRTLNPNVPEAAREILRKMLAKDPDERFQSPQELLQALQDPANFSATSVPSYVHEPAASRARPVAKPRTPKQEPAEVPTTIEQALRGHTAELPRPEKAPSKTPLAKKKAGRSAVREKSPARRKTTRLAAWWPWAAGWALVLVVAGVVWSVLGRGEREPLDDEQTESPQLVAKKGKTSSTAQIPRKVSAQEPMGPEEPRLPRIMPLPQPQELGALRREFLGPFEGAPATPADGRVVKVRRLPGPAEYRSVAEAIAKTTDPIVVEIHDQGPLFEASLPEVHGRSIHLRAGSGYRPLVAWDQATSQGTSPFITVFDGGLTLEDIDIVTKCPAGRGAGPDSMFQVRGGDFQAIDSSFTVAGTSSQNLAVVRLAKVADDTTRAKAGQGVPLPARALLRRCTIRGSSVVCLSAEATPLEALVEGSLLVGGDRPLIELTGPPEHEITVRLVRSTLVSGENCVHWKGVIGKLTSPHLKVLAWDSLIARPGTATGEGNMFALDGSDVVHVGWRSVNSVYAGWKRLLLSSDKTVGAGSLGIWRALWSIPGGDQEIVEPWPPQLPAESETSPRQAFSLYETTALFAASGGSGPLGCALGRLPPEPRLPLQRTFDPYPMPLLALPDGDEPPPIPTAEEDGLYVGERLDLAKLDLGRHLQARLRELRPGPRVVLHLAGKGKQYTSPIKVSGIGSLVLYFEPPADGDEPLTLLANPQAIEELGALIDVEGGNLEVIRGRMVLENKRAGAVPAHLLRMRGGNLVLTGCYLQGALDNAPDNYRGLIAHEGTGSASLVLTDNVLLSSRSILDLRGGAQVRLRNCAALGTDNGLVLAPGDRAGADIFVHLENNTLAIRNAAIAAATAEADGSGLAGVILVQSQHNYYLNPFADKNHSAQLLRVSGADLARGVLQWQGKANAFDLSRLRFFGADNDAIGKSIKDWHQLWGTPGEQDPSFVEPVKLSKSFNIDPPSWAYLDLPASVRAGSGPPPFGADLVRLGIIKRKR